MIGPGVVGFGLVGILGFKNAFTRAREADINLCHEGPVSSFPENVTRLSDPSMFMWSVGSC